MGDAVDGDADVPAPHRVPPSHRRCLVRGGDNQREARRVSRDVEGLGLGSGQVRPRHPPPAGPGVAGRDRWVSAMFRRSRLLPAPGRVKGECRRRAMPPAPPKALRANIPQTPISPEGDRLMTAISSTPPTNNKEL